MLTLSLLTDSWNGSTASCDNNDKDILPVNPFTADPGKVTLCHAGLAHHF